MKWESADIAAASALALARAMRERELTSEQVTRHFLACIERRNAELGALVELWPERALERARHFDRAVARGKAPRGILAGVPTAIKDTDPVRGAHLRFGSRVFRHLWSPVDGPVTMRVRSAGVHIVGKTATSELALMPVVETDIHAPCRNPWASEYPSGGSSGGAAAAVGGGLLPIAHASDAAGSIRIPASLCGVFGFKPSRGVHPSYYFGVDPERLCVVCCVARTVDDCAAFLDVMAGHSSSWDAVASSSYLARAQAAPSRLRIRFCTSTRAADVAPEVHAATHETVRMLRELGHDVQEAASFDAEIDEFLPVWQRMAANMPLPPLAPVQATTRWLRKRGRRFSRTEISELAGALRQRVLDWFGDVDLWLTPTVGPHPLRVGEHRLASDDGEAQFRAVAPLGAFTAPFNLSGQPCMTLPAGAFPSGVRIGVQLVGRVGRDAQVLAVARQLESVGHKPDLPRL